MVGIYEDKFVDFLKESLGEPVKLTSKNLIVRCPWCEDEDKKGHYHLHISLEAPIFHCFHADCPKEKGIIPALVKKITGNDISEKFFDKQKLKIKDKPFEDENIFKSENVLVTPEIKEDRFRWKSLYMKKRFGFSDRPFDKLKGLIFDVEQFVRMNRIQLDSTGLKMLPFLQENFIGILTDHESQIVFRNIDESSQFRYYKYRLKQTGKFSDYYSILGDCYDSKIIVLAEGIFDILLENLNNTIGIKNKAKLYAAGLSTAYLSLIKSIVFYEEIFRPEIHILSDNGIKIDNYKQMKNYNKHIIDKIVIYYNKTGKDFASFPVVPEKIII